MSKLTFSLAIDAAMLLAFAMLQSWPLTGVPMHEYLGLTFLMLALAHLAIHGRWVESRAPKLLRAGSLRGRLNVLLNLLLFVAMGTALTSGVFMSKVLLPNRLSPGGYLSWHQLHENSSTLALVIVGLHVALNWDLIAGGIRHAWRRNGPRGVPGLVASPPPAGVALRRVAWIAASASLLAVAVWRVQPLVSRSGQVMFVYADGRRELGAPPADLPRLRRGTTNPDIAHGTPKAAVAFAAIGVIAVLGRKLLRLRLE
jgi:hypothetical protein